MLGCRQFTYSILQHGIENVDYPCCSRTICKKTNGRFTLQSATLVESGDGRLDMQMLPRMTVFLPGKSGKSGQNETRNAA